MDKRKFFTKRDLIITVILLTVSVVFYIFINSSQGGDVFTVKLGQNDIEHINFSKAQGEQFILIDGEYPLEVHYDKDGVWIENASCPDKVCEHTGKIEKQGQSIICIPSAVSVEIDGQAQFDAVTY